MSDAVKEKLLTQASDILQAVTTTVGKATDLAASQIPDIAMEYVLWGRATQTTIELFALFFMGAGIWLFISVGFKDKFGLGESSYDSDWHGGRIFAAIAGCALLIFSAVPFFCELPKTLMVWFAPKVWLIKEIVNIIK